MIYAHYGHNYGDVPVCSGKGPEGIILPYGEGMTSEMCWCPECQRILKEISGRPILRNTQLDLFMVD